MINNIQLKRNDILLLLPPITEQLTRTQASGLEVPTLQSQTYDPVYGTVLTHAPGCKHVMVGDECFFQIFTFSTGRDRAYGDDRNEKFKDEYLPVTHIAFEEDGRWYMIISESELYFLVRHINYNQNASVTGVHMLNDYVIASPVTENNILRGVDLDALMEVDLTNKGYLPNQAVICASDNIYLPTGYKVHTLRYCDITIEEQLNNPILEQFIKDRWAHNNTGHGYFIIESQNIIAINMAKSYKAGQKRLIIKPDEIESTTSSGLINLAAEKQRCLTGTVISVGPDCAAWNVGEKVLYARNSGMPIEDAEGSLLVLEDKDVFAGVSEEEDIDYIQLSQDLPKSAEPSIIN